MFCVAVNNKVSPKKTAESELKLNGIMSKGDACTCVTAPFSGLPAELGCVLGSHE